MRTQTSSRFFLAALLTGALALGACAGDITRSDDVVDLITNVGENGDGSEAGSGDAPPGTRDCGCDQILEVCPAFGESCAGGDCAQVCSSDGGVCVQCSDDENCTACENGAGGDCQNFTCQQWYDACQDTCDAGGGNPHPGECGDDDGTNGGSEGTPGAGEGEDGCTEAGGASDCGGDGSGSGGTPGSGSEDNCEGGAGSDGEACQP